MGARRPRLDRPGQGWRISLRVFQVALHVLLSASLIAGCGEQRPVSAEPVVAKGSFSGLYEWFGDNELPLPETSVQTYRRFVWKELERGDGDYDFAPIESALRAARAKRQKFGFRIMACWSGMGSVVPEYLNEQMSQGFWFSSEGRGKPDTYVPDWNSPSFLEHARRLLAALGKRFDGDPALGWVDIGIYGNWGEWHTGGFPYREHPEAAPGTLASKKAIIDAHFKAFPHTRLLMMTDDAEGLDYALRLSPEIGMRRDSLGHKWFEEGLESYTRTWDLASERWKTAPFVAEFYAPTPPGMFHLAAIQVARFHVTMVGNGNLSTKFGQLPSDDRAELTRIHALAGARFSVNGGSAALGASKKIVTATWEVHNLGNVPAYDFWDVRCVLRKKSGEFVADAETGLDLRNVIPSDTYHRGTTAITLSSTVGPGDYEVLLVAQDPSGYLPNQPIGTIVDPSTHGFLLGAFHV